MTLLDVMDVHRSYTGPSGSSVPVLRGVSLQVPEGQMHAVMGPSGSGKSTLLRVLACMDTPDEGAITLGGTPLPPPWSSAGDSYRNRDCGIVLQDHLLIDRATAVENAALPLTYAHPRVPARVRRAKATEILTRLGLGERLNHPASRLSGGERQRVAIARAVIMDPPLLLADEPTGALDQARTQEVMALLRSMARPGRAIVVVTHDPAVAEACDHTWQLRSGTLL